MNAVVQITSHSMQQIAIANRLAEAEAAPLQDWPSAPSRRQVTPAEVEAFITHVADTGYYKDDQGNPVKADDLFLSLCVDWLHHRKDIPGMTYVAFWDLAEVRCQLEAYGA